MNKININEEMLFQMYKLAKKAAKNGEIPVSCLILDNEGKVVSFGLNRRQKSNNVLGHAEIIAILRAEKRNRDWRLDGYSMIVSLEPCDMCSMIIKECRLDAVYYLLPRKSNDFRLNVGINKIQLDGYDDFKEKFKFLLTNFFDNKR